MKKNKTPKTEQNKKATYFDVSLRHGDKDALVPVLEMLIEHGSHEFHWEHKLLDIGQEFELTISSCWADNLCEIAQLLGDYTGK